MVGYEKETDRYGEKVGRLMRILEGEMKGKDVKKLREVEWKKSGMVMLSMKDPGRGTLELMIEAMEDSKAKAARTAEVLANIYELEKLGIPESAAILVYLRHGVPLRIVIDGETGFVLPSDQPHGSLPRPRKSGGRTTAAKS